MFLYVLPDSKWKPLRWAFIISLLFGFFIYLDSNNPESQYFQPDQSVLTIFVWWVVLFVAISLVMILFGAIFRWLMPPLD